MPPLEPFEVLPRQTLSLNSLHSNSSQRAIQGYLLVILSVPRTCAIQPAFTRTGNELSNHVRLLLLIATQLAQMMMINSPTSTQAQIRKAQARTSRRFQGE